MNDKTISLSSNERSLLDEARAYVLSFAAITKHPTAPADALDLARRIQEFLDSPTDETTERRLAEACERLRRCAALVAMGGDQSMALAINRHSERLLGDISAWSERETSEQANEPPLAHSPDIRQELSRKGDIPASQYAGILKAAESGDSVNTMDLINALWWRVRNQQKEIARLHEKRKAPEIAGRRDPLDDYEWVDNKLVPKVTAPERRCVVCGATSGFTSPLNLCQTCEGGMANSDSK